MRTCATTTPSGGASATAAGCAARLRRPSSSRRRDAARSGCADRDASRGADGLRRLLPSSARALALAADVASVRVSSRAPTARRARIRTNRCRGYVSKQPQMSGRAARCGRGKKFGYVRRLRDWVRRQPDPASAQSTSGAPCGPLGRVVGGHARISDGAVVRAYRRIALVDRIVIRSGLSRIGLRVHRVLACCVFSVVLRGRRERRRCDFRDADAVCAGFRCAGGPPAPIPPARRAGDVGSAVRQRFRSDASSTASSCRHRHGWLRQRSRIAALRPWLAEHRRFAIGMRSQIRPHGIACAPLRYTPAVAEPPCGIAVGKLDRMLREQIRVRTAPTDRRAAAIRRALLSPRSSRNCRVVAYSAGRPGTSRWPITSIQPRSSSCLTTCVFTVTPRISSISPRVTGCRYAMIASVSSTAREYFGGFSGCRRSRYARIAGLL